MNQEDRHGLCLKHIAEASRKFVDTPSSGGASSYFMRLWAARVKMKDAVDTLPTAKSLAQNLDWTLDDVHGVIDQLQEDGFVVPLEVREGREPVLLATIDAIELLRVAHSPVGQLPPELLADVRERVSDVLRAETYRRLLESMTPGKVSFSAKMAVFGFFLLLTGAVSQSSALIVETNENNQQLEYLDALADHMDSVSKQIFPRSHALKGAKGGKSFKAGQLDDTLRRRKELETAVGHQVFVYDEKSSTYHFDLYDGDSVRGDRLTALLKVLVERLRHYAGGNEWDASNLKRLTEEFQFKNPVPVAYRRFLFQGPPPGDWFFVFSYYLDEVLRGSSS